MPVLPAAPPPGTPLEIEVIVSPPFMENTWLLHHGDGSACAIVDPGFQPAWIISHLRRRRLVPEIILLTHGHADHIAGNSALKQEWPDVPLVIGTGDAHLLVDPVANLSGLGGVDVISPPADRLLHEGERLSVAGLDLEVREIPGHSPGHIVYVVHGLQPTLVIGGDVLFQGSIGRCDFPGGDQELLVRGIREKLFTLPAATIVYPGHGDPTTVGEERSTNPFCGERAGLFDLN